VRRRSKFMVVFSALGLALLPAIAQAHGGSGAAPPPTLWNMLTNWQFDPLFLLILGLTTWIYIAGVQRVNRLHPRSPYPRKRTAFFLSGNLVLVIALISPPAMYDTDLFSIHMVQHLLLTMVAAPLLLLGTPVTLALRAATPELRRGVLLPMLHSRVVRALTFPVLSWGVFAAVMWGSHFSPIFEDALVNTWDHRLEHVIFLGAALMFWWPAIAVDPSPWRMPHPVRMLYIFLQMPQSSFLGVSIFSTDHILYRHYATLVRTWGPSALIDQQSAGLIMWLAGDMMFLFIIACIGVQWMHHEDREAKRIDRQLARERAERQAAKEASRGGVAAP